MENEEEDDDSHIRRVLLDAEWHRKIYPYSTQYLETLPEPEEIRRRVQIQTALDTMVSWGGSWQYIERDGGITMADYCDDCDDLAFVFAPEGTVIKGFHHESPMNLLGEDPSIWPGIFDSLSEKLAAYLHDPIFNSQLCKWYEATFCIWRLQKDTTWSIGPVQFPPLSEGNDGSPSLFYRTLHPDPLEWVGIRGEEHPEEEVEAVRHIYETLHIDEATAKRINPEVDFDAIRDELRRIGMTVS